MRSSPAPVPSKAPWLLELERRAALAQAGPTHAGATESCRKPLSEVGSANAYLSSTSLKRSRGHVNCEFDSEVGGSCGSKMAEELEDEEDAQDQDCSASRAGFDVTCADCGMMDRGCFSNKQWAKGQSGDMARCRDCVGEVKQELKHARLGCFIPSVSPSFNRSPGHVSCEFDAEGLEDEEDAQQQDCSASGAGLDVACAVCGTIDRGCFSHTQWKRGRSGDMARCKDCVEKAIEKEFKKAQPDFFIPCALCKQMAPSSQYKHKDAEAKDGRLHCQRCVSRMRFIAKN